ncbi:flagellar export chaperone FliS [Paenibacillus frigoriresistens]|uniref:flagellar export chaperone FliS n=1 Tax=Paenibacillus alginolyticus TaxID=59839 RepID=UPI001565720C|nr:flagellar export chaperone FliS [Paenibacillus frigoriresistens]NRF93675.1 flagellar export chaperone FliS [Paenibacillus frigoriresistens]
MIPQQQNKYLENTVQNATPAQLLIMLCDGAIRFCKLGIEGINQKKYDDANKYLFRVQDIIKEFIITLDQNSTIAEQLLPLYEYFIQRITEANTKKDPNPAIEVLGFLVELKETWLQAAKSAMAAPGIRHG